jgi:hypothetical protein
VFSATASADTQFNLTSIDVWMKEVDIFIYTNDADVGNIDNQSLYVAANDVYTIKGIVNIREIYFKNHTAGNNTSVAVAGVTLSDFEKKQAGIG